MKDKIKNSLREYRSMSILKNYELAKMVNISLPTMIKYERGERCPSVMKAYEIVNALNLRLTTLRESGFNVYPDLEIEKIWKNYIIN